MVLREADWTLPIAYRVIREVVVFKSTEARHQHCSQRCATFSAEWRKPFLPQTMDDHPDELGNRWFSPRPLDPRQFVTPALCLTGLGWFVPSQVFGLQAA